MDITEIIVEESPWFILLCILVGAIYSYFLYRKISQWSKTVNRILAVLRFILVTILCYLFLVPLIKQTKNLIEKPIIVLAMDNSESMIFKDSTNMNQLVQQLIEARNNLNAQGYQVDFTSFDPTNNELENNRFNKKNTNISSLLNGIKTTYENRNLVSTVLISDGINNLGFSPEYLNLNFPVNTVGIGDTSIPNDLFVRNVFANKIAYKGNKFPVRAEIGNKGFKGEKIAVVSYLDGERVEQKNIELNSDNGVQEVEFIMDASKAGKHQLTVRVLKRDSEFNTKNNSRDIYIDVVDGKQKVLILARAPHPDIKAIKAVTEKLQNYALDIVFEGEKIENKDKYDLVIFHQIPSKATNVVELLNRFKTESKWFIAGSQTDWVKLNQMQKILKFQPKSSQTDNVFPVFNRNNDQFNYENEHAGLLAQYPPVEVPFGEFVLAKNTTVLLSQKVGNIETEKPLLCVAPEENQKIAVFVGEGLWKWRMMEYAQTENFAAFDALITKLLQFVVSANDKRKLRVFPVSDQFAVEDNVQLDVEVYNDIFEPLYNKEIIVDLTHDGSTVQYSFVNSESLSGTSGGNASRFSLGNLAKGVYNFRAATTISGKQETASGSFAVEESNLEELNTSADFDLLRKIAAGNQGEFYKSADLEKLSNKLIQSNYPNKIVSSFEELKELFHLKWIFFLLLGLATLEWSIRKYNGVL